MRKLLLSLFCIAFAAATFAQSTDKPGADLFYSHGRVNAGNSVD